MPVNRPLSQTRNDEFEGYNTLLEGVNFGG